jgi:hypothetical protein
MQLDADDPAGPAAAVDLLASVAKLAGAMPSHWPFDGASNSAKTMMASVVAGATACLPELWGARARHGDALFTAALILGCTALRSVLSLPSDPHDDDDEAHVLLLATVAVCVNLCPAAACVDLVARQGLFAALERQVALLFDPVRSAYVCIRRLRGIARWEPSPPAPVTRAACAPRPAPPRPAPPLRRPPPARCARRRRCSTPPRPSIT